MLGLTVRRRATPGRRHWCCCCFWLVYQIRGTLFIFILALLFAYLLSPLVNLIDRFLPGNRSRTIALGLAYAIFVARSF